MRWDSNSPGLTPAHQLPDQIQAVGSDPDMQEMILADQSEVQLHGPTVLVSVHYTKHHPPRGAVGANEDL